MAGSFVDQVNQTGVSALGFERHVAVSGISDQDLFATMHELFEQVRIVHFRGAGAYGMNQAAAASLALAVLRAARCRQVGGVRHRRGFQL